MFKIFTYSLTALLVAIAGLGLFLPNNYKIEKSILIDAPSQEVHHYIGDLAKWEAWRQTKQADPSLEITITQATGESANQRWDSENGTGSIQFLRSDEYYGIDYDLIYEGQQPTRAGIHYSSENGKTKVTWTLTGIIDVAIFGPYTAMLMDPIMGPTFEQSLERLKQLSEG